MHDFFVDRPVRDPVSGSPNPHVAEPVFLELYALCQSLPGPGSTQLATVLGATFGGLPGAVIAFIVFALPGMAVMTLAGIWYHGHLQDAASIGLITTLNEYLIGLIAAAFTMVCLAALKIIGKCCGDDKVKWAVCVGTATVAVVIPPEYSSSVFIGLLVAGGIISILQKASVRSDDEADGESADDDFAAWECGIRLPVGWFLVVAFSIFTAFALAAHPERQESLFGIWKIFWTIGAIGFGGGIVVIPMMLNAIVESGMLPENVFLAGFALFGCVPGPMFNLAAFLGAAIASYSGALFAAVGIFAPGFTIVCGLLPFWEQVRKKRLVRDFIKGVNSAAAGLIVGGIWMLLKRTLVGPSSFALSVSAAAAMYVYKIPSPIAIALHGVLGAVFVFFGIGPPFKAS